MCLLWLNIKSAELEGFSYDFVKTWTDVAVSVRDWAPEKTGKVVTYNVFKDFWACLDPTFSKQEVEIALF